MTLYSKLLHIDIQVFTCETVKSHDVIVDKEQLTVPPQALDAACPHVSDRSLLSPAGQFLGGRTGFELDGQRGSVHVVSASRHAEQHGVQPHRGLSGRCMWTDGWTELETHSPPPSNNSDPHLFIPSPPDCTKNNLPPARLYFDTVKTIMGFFFNHSHPF